ncbi:MAG TPA: hypothetical protein VE944_12430 [Nostoc sp.]|nr:hypothetical protein [Nostoc sp.]
MLERASDLIPYPALESLAWLFLFTTFTRLISHPGMKALGMRQEAIASKFPGLVSKVNLAVTG